jgi:hypothetical protein
MPVVWETTQSLTQLTAVVDTEQFSAVADLQLAIETQFTITLNSDQTTPADPLIVRVYVTADDSSETWGLWAQWSYLPPDTNDHIRSFTLPAYYRVRFGVESAATSDTYVVDFEYKRRTS